MSFSRNPEHPDQIDGIRDEMLSTVEIAIREVTPTFKYVLKESDLIIVFQGDDETRKHLMEKANPVGKGKCHCRWRSPN